MPTTPFEPEHFALRETVQRLVDGPLAQAAVQAEAGGLPHVTALRQCADVGLLDLDDVRAEVVAAGQLGRLPSGGLVAVLLDAMTTTALGLPALETAVNRGAAVHIASGRVEGELPFVVGGRLASRCLLVDHHVVVDLSGAEVEPAARGHAVRGAAGASVSLSGAPCEGFEVEAAQLQRAELREAAAAVGGAWRTWSEARDYARQREAFGRPIGSFQVNRHALADAATKITAAEALVHDTAWAWFRGRPCEAAPARLYAGAVALEVADRAIQLHGGYGYTMEFDAQRAWRDAHALRVGDDERRRRMAPAGAAT